MEVRNNITRSARVEGEHVFVVKHLHMRQANLILRIGRKIKYIGKAEENRPAHEKCCEMV
jgi:hypothetical protein